MRRQGIQILSALVALLVLSACESFKKDPPKSAGDVVELGLTLDGQAIDQKSLDLVAAFNDVFGAYSTGDKRNELGEALMALDEGRSVDTSIEALGGLSGFSAAELAARILFPNQERRVSGLIGDFYFEEHTGRGHLTFDLVTEIDRGGGKRTIWRHWHITVLGKPDGKDGFRTVERVDPPGADGLYFPGTIRLPDAARDRNNPNGIWKRNLDHKLFAEGDSIEVTDVYEKIGEGRIRRLPDSHPFYRESGWSCIDLLTNGKPPALRIDPVFRNQSAYCLGGCRMGTSGQRYLINSM